MKKLSLVLLLAGFVACGDDDKKSSSSNNVSNNTTNNNTVNNTLQNNMTGAEVSAELWAMLCDSMFECPSPELLPFIGRYPSAAACKVATPPEFVSFPHFDKIISREIATFDSAKAQTCLAKWRASICDTGFDVAPAECDEVFVGSLAEGGICVDEAECADGRDCEHEPNVCEGVCTNNCGAFNCLKSEYCSNTGCVALGKVGDDCQELDQCTSGLYCISSKCAEGDSTAQGGDCQINGECSGDLICVSGKCAAFNPPSAGEPCTLGETSTFCAPGSVCTDLVVNGDKLEGTCGTAKTVGETCRVFYECESDLTCDAGDFLSLGKCVALRPNGEACANLFDCQSGICENNVCAAPTMCQ